MREVAPRRREVARRLLVVSVALAVYAGLTAGLYHRMSASEETTAPRVAVVQAARAPTRNIAIHDGWFWVDGERFFVTSVGWDPVRPGEVPWERTFRPAELESDLVRIRAAGFNTVRTWAPLSPDELALLERNQLRVLQGIWVDPAGDFADPAFRRKTLDEVVRAVEGSRMSPAVLGYLVLNEPRAKAVAKAGLDETRAFLREVVATVRALDPSAPIGYASWPGMEALDDELLDFVAFNLYPHRPRVVMDEFGLAGYVALLGRTVAKGRPLLISEFGISVSPQGERYGRGGATEPEQAETLTRLHAAFLAGGATGTSVFQWSDGWWKRDASVVPQPGDERRHDPDDPEEWFGLVHYERLDDRTGRARPALDALTTAHRAMLVEPRDGAAATDSLLVRVVAREPVRVEVSVNGAKRYPIELWSAGRDVYEGKLLMPTGGTREAFTFFILDAASKEISRQARVLRTTAPRSLALSITPVHQRVAPGETFIVNVTAIGDGAASLRVSVASFAEDRFHEDRQQVTTSAAGSIQVTLRAPDEETVLGLVVFEDDAAVPPAERAAAWAVVEVRR